MSNEDENPTAEPHSYDPETNKDRLVERLGELPETPKERLERRLGGDALELANQPEPEPPTTETEPN